MKYIDLDYSEKASEMLPALENGIFMTTKVGDKVNTMTIAWGGINFVWNKPVFVAYVRYSRDTYEMMKNTEEFTINVPLHNDLKNELAFCGTKSGRDYDKIRECNFTLIDGRIVNTPIIADCEMHYECKVIYKQAMEPNNIPESILQRYYTNNNFHVIFYGEIVDSYIIKGE
ncbi:Flavoredoxin [Candidatus Izimaplasma bacterium HR1]|jgi:flavin reductase (DIM6/NTAB) family NADH-FMN oxidoreductase RutF|uniref:flavin reductase family protein n=1 Tax=Candidatus Izimoplasma sp. HR1 TaxID=1541959 RepID=UPI0004F5B47B|nr:Flavoredoxin [Candidatus Izimaplasma bacterium HR1]